MRRWFVLISLLLSLGISANEINRDSLNVFAAKIEILEHYVREKSYYNKEYSIFSNDFKEIVYNRDYDDNEFNKYLVDKFSRRGIEGKKDRILSSYFRLPDDNYNIDRELELEDHGLLITVLKDVSGFERIFNVLCIWKIEDSNLTLLGMYEKPIAVSIGRIMIKNCLEFNNGELILILAGNGGDDDSSWGRYEFYQFSLFDPGRIQNIYRIRYKNNPRGKTEITNRKIVQDDHDQIILSYTIEKYEPTSDNPMDPKHEYVSEEKITVNLSELIKN